MSGAGVFALLAGCELGPEAAQIRDGSRGYSRITDMLNVRKDCQKTDVQLAMIECLGDKDAAIRYYACESLPFCTITDPKIKERACEGFVELLDDQSFGSYGIPAAWGLVTVCGKTPSVRVAALMALVRFSQKDFGFDQMTWRTYLNTKYEPKTGDRTPGTVTNGMKLID